jgi:hypothetical protein
MRIGAARSMLALCRNPVVDGMHTDRKKKTSPKREVGAQI